MSESARRFRCPSTARPSWMRFTAAEVRWSRESSRTVSSALTRIRKKLSMIRRLQRRCLLRLAMQMVLTWRLQQTALLLIP